VYCGDTCFTPLPGRDLVLCVLGSLNFSSLCLGYTNPVHTPPYSSAQTNRHHLRRRSRRLLRCRPHPPFPSHHHRPSPNLSYSGLTTVHQQSTEQVLAKSALSSGQAYAMTPLRLKTALLSDRAYATMPPRMAYLSDRAYATKRQIEDLVTPAQSGRWCAKMLSMPGLAKG